MIRDNPVNCPDCKYRTICKTDGTGRRTWICVRCDQEIPTTTLPSGVRIAVQCA